MIQILSVGLTEDWVDGLIDHLSAEVHTAETLSDAKRVLSERDIVSVVLNLRRLEIPCQYIFDLMGSTPLTTRFYVLCEEGEDLDRDSLALMGVTTMLSSCALDELLQRMPH